MALVMVEGTWDAFFRAREEVPASGATDRHDFGTPVQFVPQKQRVFAQLRTVSGAVRALGKVLSPRTWRRVFPPPT
jgi:hypothetical protein